MAAAPPATPAPPPQPSGLVWGIINTLSDFVANLGGVPPPEERDPALAASTFVRNFESQYGPSHPAFLECSYGEAVRRARNEYRFLLVYLHCGLHADIPAFCRTTMTSEALSEFINDNFLIWGGDVAFAEPMRVSYMIGATTYPVLCVLVNYNSTVELVERIEGPIGPEELMNRLTTILENQGASLVADRAAQEEREMDRLIRQEQDLAYEESLRADQEREELARLEQERRLEEERRVLEEERRAREEAERKANFRQAELARKRARLPPEPREGERAYSVVIRLPEGSRLTRQFRMSDPIRALYDFVDVSEVGLEMGSYSLVAGYPRRPYPENDVTMAEAGLETQTTFFVEVL